MSEAETMILLERQAKRIKELEAEIRRICKSCWAHGKNAPECEICYISKLNIEHD
jgi:hypothetical protein